MATIGKFQLHVKNNDLDIDNRRLIWLPSNHCILCLVLKVFNQVKNTVVCMASLLSSNGRSSAYFDNIRLELPKMPILSCAFTHSLRESSYNTKSNLVSTNLRNQMLRRSTASITISLLVTSFVETTFSIMF